MIHQRAASKGNIAHQNCHPFYIKKNISFAHNGTFEDLFHKEKAATFLFSEMLIYLPVGWQDKELYNKPKNMLAEVHNYNGGRVVYPIELTNYKDNKYKGKIKKDMYVSPFFKSGIICGFLVPPFSKT